LNIESLQSAGSQEAGAGPDKLKTAPKKADQEVTHAGISKKVSKFAPASGAPVIQEKKESEWEVDQIRAASPAQGQHNDSASSLKEFFSPERSQESNDKKSMEQKEKSQSGIRRASF